jgi:hypothetical protein
MLVSLANSIAMPLEKMVCDTLDWFVELGAVHK